jgi:hypothetical protein
MTGNASGCRKPEVINLSLDQRQSKKRKRHISGKLEVFLGFGM